MCQSADLPATVEEFALEADQLLDSHKTDFDHLYNKFKAAFTKYDPEQNNEALLWRMAKVCYKVAVVAEGKGDNKTRKQFLEEGEKYADKALEINNQSGDAHEWKSYIVGKISGLLPTKEKIMKGKEMEKHLQEAMKLKPDCRDVRFAHGRWAMEVAALSWLERKIASALFGKVPDATYEDAINSFEISKKLKPSKCNGYYMGKCKVQLKRYKEAIADFDEAVNTPENDEEDRIINEDLLELQKKYASYR